MALKIYQVGLLAVGAVAGALYFGRGDDSNNASNSKVATQPDAISSVYLDGRRITGDGRGETINVDIARKYQYILSVNEAGGGVFDSLDGPYLVSQGNGETVLISGDSLATHLTNDFPAGLDFPSQDSRKWVYGIHFPGSNMAVTRLEDQLHHGRSCDVTSVLTNEGRGLTFIDIGQDGSVDILGLDYANRNSELTDLGGHDSRWNSGWITSQERRLRESVNL